MNMNYKKMIRKSFNNIPESIKDMIIYDISEAIKNGYVHMSNGSSYYYKIVLEDISKELPKIIFIRNTRNDITGAIAVSRVTDFELEEIVPGAYIVRFEIDYKKIIVRRISNLDNIINLKPLLEKLERFDLLLKLY